MLPTLSCLICLFNISFKFSVISLKYSLLGVFSNVLINLMFWRSYPHCFSLCWLLSSLWDGCPPFCSFLVLDPLFSTHQSASFLFYGPILLEHILYFLPENEYMRFWDPAQFCKFCITAHILPFGYKIEYCSHSIFLWAALLFLRRRN